MKKIVFVFLIILIVCKSNAQKVDISYGISFGLNGSFMNSKVSFSHAYIHNDYGIRNKTVSYKNENTLGFNSGLFLKLNSLSGNFSLESGILLASYKNNYSIHMKYDRYNVPLWTDFPLNTITEEQIIILENEFLILNIPIIIGYNLNEQVKLFGGLSTYINTKSDNFKSDIELNIDKLYKDIVFGYQAGIELSNDKMFFTLKYERTFNYLENPNISILTTYYIESEIESVYLNCITCSLGFKLFSKN